MYIYTIIKNKYTMKAYKTVPQKLKEFGARINKQGRGWYTYHGVNFTVDITQEECEIKWWELDIWSDGVDKNLQEFFEGNMQWDTKGDAVWAVFCYDKSLSQVNET